MCCAGVGVAGERSAAGEHVPSVREEAEFVSPYRGVVHRDCADEGHVQPGGGDPS